MKIATADQIQKLDQTAIKRYGIPSLCLMENAGREVAYEVLAHLKKMQKTTVCLVCGTGNNGGDGLVAARHLVNEGIQVKIYCVGRIKDLKEDPAVHYRALKKLKFPITFIQKVSSDFQKDIAKADCVIDALFGVGLSRDIQGVYEDVVQEINQNAKAVIAVDVPSGLNPTTGQVFGVCVHANITVTFTCPKQGFYQRYGPHCTGEIVPVDIGIPKILQKQIKA